MKTETLKTISSKHLKAGMLLETYYGNGGLKFVHRYEFLGFTGDDSERIDPVAFESSKDLLAHYKVKTMKELQTRLDTGNYGFHPRMVLRDDFGEVAAWFYLYEGRWCRGSGADRMAFKRVDVTELEDTIKCGKVVYELQDGDTVMDNGACLQLTTRRVGCGFDKTSPLVSKTAFKGFKANPRVHVVGEHRYSSHVVLYRYTEESK